MSTAASAAEYRFGPTEQPMFPGSPYSPAHHPWRKLAYVGVALLVGLSASLGNALVTVNLQNIAGSLGVTVAEATWLSSMYVAFNASANLLLVRARIQYGIPRVTHALLIAYAATTLLQLAMPSFGTALLVRAASGTAATGLTTMTIYNLLQIFSPKTRPLALLLGISITQFSVPLARMFPVTLLVVERWQGLHLFELGLTLSVIAALWAVPLPPSICSRAFQPLDFVTVGLVLPGMILFCGAIGAGRYVWWSDTPWVGVALAISVVLLAIAFAIEHNRERPLLQVGWLGSRDIVRFAVIALLVRFALAEQTYGAVGLLTAGGLNNDQLHLLFAVVMVAMALGTATAALTLTTTGIPWQVMTAAVIIGIGALIDSNSTNLTRPAQLYLSQSLLGFGTCLFIGPALLYGFIRVIQLGPNYLISFLVLFSASQNVGGLLGSSLLGSYQVISTRAHAGSLSEHLLASDPQVVARLSQQGVAGLYAALQREAAVLAFNDVFRAVALLSFAVALYMFISIMLTRYRQRQGSTQ
ncbi:MFS transporter [Sphingomonas sp. dw_22]|uniref:MFS transporter n=1 Tax=Sphingomonas sp. dw_22 TaxID=2721175 RepID=UPI001BD46594|nr:MFS transporter [Sphingomonas sp. dw_22]